MATRDRRGVVVDATDSIIAGDPNPGLAIKVACLVATTENIVLSGLQTIDDVVLIEGARVLVKDQTDLKLNGIYSASSGPWTRANDANGNTELANGLQVIVLSGTINGAYKVFVLTSEDPVTIGSSDIVWRVLFYPDSAIEWTIDGGGAPVPSGYSGVVEIPFDCRILANRMVSPEVGAIVFDVRRSTFANLPADPADSIVAAAPPTLAAAQTSQDVALVDWITQLRKGDWLTFYVVGIPTVTKITLSMPVTRN